MRKKLCILFAAPLVLLASCITQISDNPVDAPPGTGVDPSPFLGKWKAVTIGGYSPTNQMIMNIITATNGSILASFVSSVESNDTTVVLSAVSGATLASVQNGTNSWDIYAISTSTNAPAILTVSSPDPALISNDVKTSVINGTVRMSGEGDCSIHLKATSSQLRSYFSTRTNMFVPVMTFQKQ